MTDSLIEVPLEPRERDLCYFGLKSWSNSLSNKANDTLAQALGFRDGEHLFLSVDDLAELVAGSRPLSREQWTMALGLTEVAFVSDIFARGSSFVADLGGSESEWLHVLRRLQARLRTYRVIVHRRP